MNGLEPRSQWSSFSSYVLVTTGAMVGLGNIFQFPFLVTKYGGLFLLFYVVCQLSVALPLLFAELLIGRRGKQNPVGSIGILTMESDANKHWRKLAWLCVFIAFLTMGYYTVSAAFPIHHFIDNMKDIFQHTTPLVGAKLQLENEGVAAFFYLEICFIALLILTMLVVYRGINRGLETLSFITVPLYFIILLALACYVSMQGYFGDAVHHLLIMHTDISVYEIFLAALALAFLKYKIGMGVMMVYGSYLPYHVPLAKSTLIVVAIDAMVSLFAYFIIYPLTLASSSDGNLAVLSSHNVITIFGAIPHGLLISAIFFFTAILMAWTPIIAMAEVIVVTLVERMYWTRTFAVTITMICVFVLGTLVVGTHIGWADVVVIGGYPLHNLLKNITMDVLTPIAAFFIAIFAGWILKRNVTEGELHFAPGFYGLWLFLVRFVVPVAVMAVLFTVTVLESSQF